MLLATPVHPAFLALPYLARAERLVPLDQVINLYILGLRCRNYYYVSLPDVGGRRFPRHGGCPGGGAHRGQAGPRGGLQGQQGSERVEIQRGQNPGLARGQGHEAGCRVLGDRGGHLGRRGLQHLQSGLQRGRRPPSRDQVGGSLCRL